MSLGTTTTTAKALKNYWHDFFIENLYDNLAMKGLTKGAKVPKGSGKTVWWVGVTKVSPVGASRRTPPSAGDAGTRPLP